MPKSKSRLLPVWLLGGSSQTAKRIRAALKPGEELRRYDAASLPGQPEYARDEPLAVCLDLSLWRDLLAGAVEPPLWLRTARRVLVDAQEGPTVEPDEALAQGFLACLSAPLAKAKVRHALDAAEKNALALAGVSSVLDEAMRQRDNMAKENGRLEFFRQMLAQAMTTLDLGEIVSQVGEALGLAFPVTETQGVFWDEGAETEIFLPAGLEEPASQQRAAALLDLAERLRGGPASAYTVRATRIGAKAQAVDSRRCLLVPLRQGAAAFGCLAVYLERDLARHEQQSVRQAAAQVLPCLAHALAYARLKRQADHDGLTGLYNRRSFDARLSMELKRHMRHKEGFSLILADLDNFKDVNDTHGHLAGDQALRLVAQVLSQGLRDTDMAARYGGEEFALILPHTGQTQAWILAERLRREVAAAKLRYGGRAIALSMSVGLAGFAPGDAVTEAALVQAADRALYEAKAAGKNQVRVAPRREKRSDKTGTRQVG